MAVDQVVVALAEVTGRGLPAWVAIVGVALAEVTGAGVACWGSP